jgi:hypothetical protein
MAQFSLQQFDPCPIGHDGVFDDAGATQTQVLALDIQSKYLFVDPQGNRYHEYYVPGTPDIQNCGGYVDKVVLYRDPALFEFLCRQGVSAASFASSEFPILNTRSPRLDLALFALILELRASRPDVPVGLLDHGCTVGEHYDLLDAMLRAATHGAESGPLSIDYCGLDKSAMLLSIAQLLHAQVARERFRVVHAEGSGFSFEKDEFDLSLSVGVVNHVADPKAALEKLLMATRRASVMALWVTTEPEGFWAVNHSGVPNYFFSRSDLAQVRERRGAGSYFSLEYIPETSASQMRSYVGLGQRKLESLGCYHMVYSLLPGVPFVAQRLDI